MYIEFLVICFNVGTVHPYILGAMSKQRENIANVASHHISVSTLLQKFEWWAGGISRNGYPCPISFAQNIDPVNNLFGRKIPHNPSVQQKLMKVGCSLFKKHLQLLVASTNIAFMQRFIRTNAEIFMPQILAAIQRTSIIF